MKSTHEGLSLWYGTPDAPAPFDHAVVQRDAASLVVGVHPANPTNTILVHYRIDGGRMQAVPGHEIRVDYGRNYQYFGVRFPAFATGELVEYSVVLCCGGRQVPSPVGVRTFPSQFRLVPAESPLAGTKPSPPVVAPVGLAPDLTFLAEVTVHFNRIDYVGETPEGIRIDFYADGGGVVGPALSGTVLPGAADHMYVRRDGVGVIGVRAVIATADGAKF